MTEPREPLLKSFLWCFGLEVGTKIIASLHLIFSLVIMVLCGCMAEAFRGNVGTVEDEDLLYSTWYKIAVAITVTSSVHVLLSFLLVYGISKRNLVAIRVWLLIMAFLYIASIMFLIFITIRGGVNTHGTELFLSVVKGIAFFGIVGYCIVCVHSYFLLLKNTEYVTSSGFKS